jgi:hypothetical protein
VECKILYWRKNQNCITKKTIDGIEMPCASVGGFSEMIVCADLLKRGFYVFRSITPNAPYDVIAIKNNDIKKIEIRTALKGVRGNCRIGKKINHKENPPDNFAGVLFENNSCFYEPELA